MKLKITRDNLQQGLAAVGASIPTRTTLPVLSLEEGHERSELHWLAGVRWWF
jgi:hypothetical protein